MVSGRATRSLASFASAADRPGDSKYIVRKPVRVFVHAVAGSVHGSAEVIRLPLDP